MNGDYGLLMGRTEVDSNTRLLAYADPENAASLNVLDKAGFQRGPLKKDFYERAVFKGVKKSDLQSFHLDRPKD
jgi:RimJ/RimL family protein N-acetyltransferase